MCILYIKIRRHDNKVPRAPPRVDSKFEMTNLTFSPSSSKTRGRNLTRHELDLDGAIGMTSKEEPSDKKVSRMPRVNSKFEMINSTFSPSKSRERNLDGAVGMSSKEEHSIVPMETNEVTAHHFSSDHTIL
jgi:hypothetical protein